MLLICKKCIYPNLPVTTVCTRCGNTIQSEEDVAKKKQLWDALPEQARKDFEQKYKSAQEEYIKRPLILRKRRWKDMLLGGVALGIVGLIHGPLIIIDFMVGAFMGLVLNVIGGGSHSGALLFGMGYFIVWNFKD